MLASLSNKSSRQPCSVGGRGRQWLELQKSFENFCRPEEVILPSVPNSACLPSEPFYWGCQVWVTWGVAGKPGHLRPPAYFCGGPCWVQGPGMTVLGTSQSTCGPFQLAAEPTDLHNCNGIFNPCFNDGVSRCVFREVKAWKSADAMWSRTCTPCPIVWMREPLVYGLMLIV
eukprot:410051-Pelagomonas_calceolata.AAC.1